MKVNVEGTRNVAKTCLEARVGKLIHVSSVAALGYSDNPNQPVDEDFKFDWDIAEKRKKYYMLSKHLADEEVKRFWKLSLNCLIVYPGLMFGSGDMKNSLNLVKAIYDGKIPLNMPGGTNIVDVRDVSKGLVLAMEQGKSGEDYLLSGNNLTFKEINQTIASELGVNSPKLTIPRFMSPIYHLFNLFEMINSNQPKLTSDNVHSAFRFRYFDNSRARRDLNWQPEISFQQTIKDICKWARDEGYLK